MPRSTKRAKVLRMSRAISVRPVASVWVSEWGEASDERVTGVEMRDGVVVILTKRDVA